MFDFIILSIFCLYSQLNLWNSHILYKDGQEMCTRMKPNVSLKFKLIKIMRNVFFFGISCTSSINLLTTFCRCICGRSRKLYIKMYVQQVSKLIYWSLIYLSGMLFRYHYALQDYNPSPFLLQMGKARHHNFFF
jgi:hypothetical protein